MAVADAPSPVPLRNQSPRGANSAWSAHTALLPQTHHPNTQRGGSPPWSPGMSTGTPTPPHLGTAMARGPPNCPRPCTRPCVCSTQHGHTRAPGCRVRLRAQPPVCRAHPCVPPPRSHVCIRRRGGPGRQPGGLPGTSSLCAWCPGGGKVLEDAHGWRGQRKQSRVPAQLQPARLTLPSWLILHALALLRELGGFGVSGGPQHPCPGLLPAGTYRLLGAVAARLPRVRVVADLDFVGRHPVIPVWGRGSAGSQLPTCPPLAGPARCLTSRWS